MFSRFINILISAEYPTPKLICQPNILAELPPFSDAVEIKIQIPKTDLNIKRDVAVKPSWVKSGRIMLKAGALNVTYTARHPISKLTTSCTTTIYVVGAFANDEVKMNNYFQFNLFLSLLLTFH